MMHLGILQAEWRALAREWPKVESWLCFIRNAFRLQGLCEGMKVCELHDLMRLDKQTCDWHNKKCNSLYVTQDISKEACQAAGNAVALIRVKINPVATNNVGSRIFRCEK
jgi:hypothetical protein